MKGFLKYITYVHLKCIILFKYLKYIYSAFKIPVRFLCTEYSI